MSRKREAWKEAARLLKAADRGDIPFAIGEPWRYCGRPTYVIGGWTVEVFDDCGDWDYIEAITTPNGKRYEADAGDGLSDLWMYRPEGLLADSYMRQQQEARG